MANGKNKTISLREQSAWLLIAKIIGFGFSFMLPLVVVRYLPIDAVGHYRESFQVLTNAVVILPFGISMSAYYFLARETERRAASILNILLFNLIVGGLACFTLYLFPQILGNLFRSNEMTGLAPEIGVVIWIWIFSTFLETVAVANQEAKVATVFIIAAQFSKTLLMGAAVFAFGTVEAFIYAAMIQGVIQTFILLNYLRWRFPGFWESFDFRFFREQMAYALPFGLAGILWMAQYDIHNYFVGYKFSPSDFAIYAYGCFEVPLIAMLSDSVTSVLIPRMNALQLEGRRDEMIRITARAIQKLSFFYFPIYVFLLVTSHTFIVTLFTHRFERSASIFVINLTLLPFSVLILDPIVRSYKELGRLFLLTRFFVLTCMVGVLYFALDHLDLTGMITVAVCAIIIEKLIAETMVIRKLDLGWRHISLLRPVGKTAAASAIAGLLTYGVYALTRDFLLDAGADFATNVLQTTRLEFAGGALVLGVAGAVFAPTYLVLANLLGLIEEDEKESVRGAIRKVFQRRPSVSLADTSA